MNHSSLSVIVPCYNEASVIYETLVTLADFLHSKGILFEIIPVDDGSTDTTVQEIKRAQKDLSHIVIKPIYNAINYGKGQAVKDGVAQSRHKIILFIDADLTISIEELETFLPEIDHHDIIIASRALAKTHFEENNPWYRVFLAKGFRFSQNIILGKTRIKDTQCGFKVFKKEVAKRIFKHVTIQRFAFDAEALFLAKKYKYSVKQLPVTIHKDTRESHVNAILDPINMIFALLKIRVNALLGKYDQH